MDGWSWIEVPRIFGNLLVVAASVVLHELGHGIMAFIFGDKTAQKSGRLSLNPVKHMDGFGTVILPVSLYLLKAPFLFGYAKPVPVNANSFRYPRLMMPLVAMAGPFVNIALVMVSYSVLINHVWATGSSELLRDLLIFSVQINLVLAVFNAFPLPPLDGGHVLKALTPPALMPLYRPLEKYGKFIVLLLFLTPQLCGYLNFDLHPLHWWIDNGVKLLKSTLGIR